MKYSKFITLTIALVTVGTSMTGIPFINEKQTAYASESTLGKSYVEHGKTNIDLETTDGSIIEKGTPVARASRMKKSISGSYYLVLYDGVFMYQAWGEVPEKYVTSAKIELQTTTEGKFLIKNDIPESADKAPLKPVKGEETVAEKGFLGETVSHTRLASENPSLYTKETFNVFKKAFDQATRVLNDSSATQAQVDAADTSLTNAFNNLKKSEKPSESIDKIGLGKVIYDAKIYEKDDRYTKESRDKLVIERQKAEKVMKNERATQAEVDKMTNSLSSAFKTVLVEVSKAKPEGNYIKDGRYVTYSNKNYNTYSNFGWKHRQSGSSLQNKTFQARGKYNHQNGSTYLSLYDNKGTWYGYVNEKAVKVGGGQQGAYIKDGRYVTLTNKNYNSWSNFGWKYRHSGASLVNKTYQAKGKYNHINGSTYLSLYDNKGKWFGYINEKATKIGNGQQGAYVADGRKVKVTKKNYQLWQNFSWKKRQSSNKLVGKTFVARGKYYHANGSTYYSLFDNKGNWQGYINANGVK